MYGTLSLDKYSGNRYITTMNWTIPAGCIYYVDPELRFPFIANVAIEAEMVEFNGELGGVDVYAVDNVFYYVKVDDELAAVAGVPYYEGVIPAGTIFTISVDLNERTSRLVAKKDIKAEIRNFATKPGEVSVYWADNVWFFVDFVDGAPY
jgi:hypothetical protein